MKSVYLDHAATTPIDSRVLEAMQPYLTSEYGNPSSYHQMGIANRKAINTARKSIAMMLKCAADEIIFTSGGTESINVAIKGLAFANPQKKEIITTSVEHKAAVNALKFLENMGYLVHYLKVDQQGLIDLNQLDGLINHNTLFVSIIWANNEIGTLQDMHKILEITQKHGVILHVDAVQMIGQVPFDLKRYPVDLLTFSSHKFYGPKGIGGLYVKKHTPLIPLIHGGGQEYDLRSGTENLAGIVGMEKAMAIAFEDLAKNMVQKQTLSTLLYEGLKTIYDIKLNGTPIGDQRLPGHLSISFKSLDGFDLAFALDQKGIYVSTGSACTSQIIEPSHVLKAIEVGPDYVKGNLRLSLGNHQTKADIDYVLKAFKDIL